MFKTIALVALVSTNVLAADIATALNTGTSGANALNKADQAKVASVAATVCGSEVTDVVLVGYEGKASLFDVSLANGKMAEAEMTWQRKGLFSVVKSVAVDCL